MKELQLIQGVLKAPKGQYNDFAHYKYRSCEDIVEAVKPLLKTYECFLTMSDELVLVGDRYYIKATCTITNKEWKQVTTYGWAREEESKKWLDWPMLSWCSSSYARKYWLCWLLAIDDWVDSDSLNKWEVKETKAEDDDKEWITKDQIIAMKDKTDWIKWFKDADAFVRWAREKFKVNKENAKLLEKLYNVTVYGNEDGWSAIVVE